MVIIIYRILNARQLCIDFLKLNGIKLGTVSYLAFAC
jgi:hypothetical protein